MKNQKLFDHVSAEQMDSILFVTKTKPYQSSAEGKGISEVTFRLEAQITVTTRNAKREQCHEDHDCVQYVAQFSYTLVCNRYIFSSVR